MANEGPGDIAVTAIADNTGAQLYACYNEALPLSTFRMCRNLVYSYMIARFIWRPLYYSPAVWFDVP